MVKTSDVIELIKKGARTAGIEQVENLFFATMDKDEFDRIYAEVMSDDADNDRSIEVESEEMHGFFVRFRPDRAFIGLTGLDVDKDDPSAGTAIKDPIAFFERMLKEGMEALYFAMSSYGFPHMLILPVYAELDDGSSGENSLKFVLVRSGEIEDLMDSIFDMKEFYGVECDESDDSDDEGDIYDADQVAD